MVLSTRHTAAVPNSAFAGPIRRAPYPPHRILLVPGPSNLHPRVIQAMCAPIVSHKDPAFIAVMDETSDLLKMVFQTANLATFALPATGGSGMEAAILNLVEPGDTLVVGSAGFFADRMLAIGDRIGEGAARARVITVRGELGQAVGVEELIDAARREGAKAVAVVHGETSTGVRQPLEGLGQACAEMGAYLIVDAVASLAGVPIPVDELQIDICYSGSQKCLSAPPGLAPITVSNRAMEAIGRRRVPSPSWYLDLPLHARYWGAEHIYHHTAPILSVYALLEALRMVEEEGLTQRFARHRLHAGALCAGLTALGLKLFAPDDLRLDTVITVEVPAGVPDAPIRDALLSDLNIEITGGLGPLAGRIWRIGVMGHSAQRSNFVLLLAGLERLLSQHGHVAGSGVETAEAFYAEHA